MQQNKDGERNLFKQFGLFSLLLLLGNTIVFAGSFEDFKRVQSESFTQYKDKRDNAFNNYLKAEWQEYKASMTKPMYAQPKPKSLSPKEEQKAPDVGPIVQIKLPQDKQIIVPQQVAPQETNKDIHFDFFGSYLGFNIDKNIYKAKFYPQNQTGIANFFSILAASNYEDTLSEIKTRTTETTEKIKQKSETEKEVKKKAASEEAARYSKYLKDKVTFLAKMDESKQEEYEEFYKSVSMDMNKPLAHVHSSVESSFYRVIFICFFSHRSWPRSLRLSRRN